MAGGICREEISHSTQTPSDGNHSQRWTGFPHKLVRLEDEGGVPSGKQHLPFIRISVPPDSGKASLGPEVALGKLF